MEQLPRFIKPMHPKSEVSPEEGAIKKVLRAGWWGQPKIHGHRAQIHLSRDSCFVYTRKGHLHKETLTPKIESELHRLFAPKEDWNVIDAEWLKPEQKIYVFDFLKQNGKMLHDRTFAERYELLPKDYLSPHISTLPVFKTLERCLSYLANPQPKRVEGLVFRSAFTKGFSNDSIVRCRSLAQATSSIDKAISTGHDRS